MNELLIGAIVLGAAALVAGRNAWNDSVGERFNREYRDLCDNAETSAKSMVEETYSNAQSLQTEISIQSDYLRECVDRISRELDELERSIESINM